jgi:hypothetical protein
MSRHFIWLPVILTIGVALYNPVKEARIQKKESKSISFSIYKGYAYTSEAYNNSTAQVRIIVEKIDTKGTHTKVWDKTLGTQGLSQYPSIEKAVSQNIVVPNVDKSKEHLEVTYILIYNSDGTELQMQGGEVLSGTDNKVDISI